MQLSSVDLNLLVALDVLLEERSVSKAATRLMVGQPAMSATLGRLRALFNDPLLVREGRALSATPYAESLIAPVREILERIEAIVNVGSDFDPATDHRTFSIAASDYASIVLVRPLIELLPTVAPNVRIQLRLVESDIVGQVVRGQVDMLVIPRELLAPSSDLPVTELFDDSFVLATAADNPDLPESAELSVETFTTLPYLSCRSAGLPSLAEQRLDELGVARNVEMVAQSFVMAPFLLPGTRLVTVIQSKLAEVLLPRDRFRTMPMPLDLGRIHEVLISAPKRYTDTSHEWLRGQLQSVASGI